SASILALASVDDHGDVRVVLVVLDHLVVEVVRELGRNDAIDHALQCMQPLARTSGQSGKWFRAPAIRHAPQGRVLGRPDIPADLDSLRPGLAARAAWHP